MWERLRTVWLPRVLFVGTQFVALTLAAAVLASPRLLPYVEAPPPLLEIFAGDATVRRTCLASAAALVATAFVFFRPSVRKKPSSKPPTPGKMAGA